MPKKAGDPPKENPLSLVPPRTLTPEERANEFADNAMKYRDRVQSASRKQRLQPAATYAVGRAALDEAMAILGAGRFGRKENAQEEGQ
jgi:hypothetical protein